MKGPLFVMGMPRSGTKLTAALLNQNEKIDISPSESHFIPFFVRRLPGPPFTPSAVRKIVRILESTSFGERLRRPDGRAGKLMEELSGARTWEETFRAIYASCSSKEAAPRASIWGDRTVGLPYLRSAPAFKRLFGSSKFIHVIRDPRDRALSVRNAWGQNVARSAWTWSQAVRLDAELRVKLGPDYRAVRYESLLDDPEGTLRSLCGFVGCEYSDRMLQLDRPPEKYHGPTAGIAHIVRDRQGSFRGHLTPEQIEAIERIAYPAMLTAGYAPLNASVELVPPPRRWTRWKWAVHDILARWRYFARAKGWAAGSRHYASLVLRSSVVLGENG